MTRANGKTMRQRLDHQRVVLEEQTRVSTLDCYPVVPDNSTRARLRKALESARYKFPLSTMTQEEVSIATVWSVADSILGAWKPEQKHGFITQDRIAEKLSISMRTAQRAISALQQAGLFGVITGTEGRASQFYPLFHGPSLNEFERIVGIVDANTSRTQSREKAPEGKTLPDPSAVPVRIPEVNPTTLAGMPELVRVAVLAYMERAGERDMNALAHYHPGDIGLTGKPSLGETRETRERAIIIREHFLTTRSEDFYRFGSTEDTYRWQVRYAAADIAAHYNIETGVSVVPVGGIRHENIEALASAGIFAVISEGSNLLLFPMFERNGRIALARHLNNDLGELEQILGYHPLSDKPSPKDHWADYWAPANKTNAFKASTWTRGIDPVSKAKGEEREVVAPPMVESMDDRNLRLVDDTLMAFAQKTSRRVPLLPDDATVAATVETMELVSVSDLEFLVPNTNAERLPRTLQVAKFIAEQFDPETGTCVVSFAAISEAIDVPSNRIAPVVDLLRQAGLFAYLPNRQKRKPGTFIPTFHSRGIDAIESLIRELSDRQSPVVKPEEQKIPAPSEIPFSWVQPVATPVTSEREVVTTVEVWNQPSTWI
ncbi:helix-turn-helix domain-containing protein [Citricoccus zhacaiensis]